MGTVAIYDMVYTKMHRFNWYFTIVVFTAFPSYDFFFLFGGSHFGQSLFLHVNVHLLGHIFYEKLLCVCDDKVMTPEHECNHLSMFSTFMKDTLWLYNPDDLHHFFVSTICAFVCVHEPLFNIYIVFYSDFIRWQIPKRRDTKYFPYPMNNTKVFTTFLEPKNRVKWNGTDKKKEKRKNDRKKK